MKLSAILFCVLALLGCAREPSSPASTLVLWAWERPEDLRFAPASIEVAVLVGFVEIAGDGIEARGRRFPLQVARPPETAVVHVEISHRQPLRWTPALRSRLSAAVLHYARAFPARRVQIDFEVRASERQALLDLIADVRRGLPRGTALSMTALASWCDGEDWLNQVPADEIVPMLFRMERGGEAIERRLAAGGDFRNSRCRSALGVATDSPIGRAPPGRRVYLFNPRSWSEAEFERAGSLVGGWR